MVRAASFKPLDTEPKEFFAVRVAKLQNNKKANYRERECAEKKASGRRLRTVSYSCFLPPLLLHSAKPTTYSKVNSVLSWEKERSKNMSAPAKKNTNPSANKINSNHPERQKQAPQKTQRKKTPSVNLFTGPYYFCPNGFPGIPPRVAYRFTFSPSRTGLRKK